MDQVKAEFIRLCDEALQEVEITQNEFLAAGELSVWQDLLNRLKENLSGIRQDAINDTLPRSGNALLGLTKAVSEWGLTEKGPSGLRVYDACRKLEQFYAGSF